MLYSRKVLKSKFMMKSDDRRFTALTPEKVSVVKLSFVSMQERLSGFGRSFRHLLTLATVSWTCGRQGAHKGYQEQEKHLSCTAAWRAQDQP
jgi:hypothetical protein